MALEIKDRDGIKTAIIEIDLAGEKNGKALKKERALWHREAEELLGGPVEYKHRFLTPTRCEFAWTPQENQSVVPSNG
jgi:hypothetical protein